MAGVGRVGATTATNTEWEQGSTWRDPTNNHTRPLGFWRYDRESAVASLTAAADGARCTRLLNAWCLEHCGADMGYHANQTRCAPSKLINATLDFHERYCGNYSRIKPKRSGAPQLKRSI